MGFIIAGVLWILGMCMMKLWFDDVDKLWYKKQGWNSICLSFVFWWVIVPVIMFVDWQNKSR